MDVVEFLCEICCRRIRLRYFNVVHVSYVSHGVNMNKYVRLCKKKVGVETLPSVNSYHDWTIGKGKAHPRKGHEGPEGE